MRRVATLVAAGVAALSVRRVVALRDSMSAVAPELRGVAVIAATILFNFVPVRIRRKAMGIRSDPGSGVVMTNHDAGDGVKAIVLAPVVDAASRPAVLWLHGGAMVSGSAHFEAQPAGRIVAPLGAVVVLPSYRLAPENPFPAALDDCMTTLRWMRKHAGELGIDADRIAVCGASSGGGLSAAVAQRCLDEGIPLRAQALVYPMLDDRTALRDDRPVRGWLTWTRSSNRRAWTHYLGREPRMSDAPDYAAPARRTDLAGLAPAWIGVGELDVFHDEDVDYAERLQAAGVPCQLVVVPGMYHGADGMFQNAPSMKRFHASMVEHLRRHLTPGSAEFGAESTAR
jgi:acetyl esterase/lipase